jgi:predicted PurR-regulated permease PerM
MRAKESNKLDQKLINKIIRVAYGDAGIVDQIYIRLKASSNEKIKELLEEYKQTANAVHTIKQENVPDQIIKSVKNYATSEQKNYSSSKLSYLISLIFRKKVIPAAALATILVIIISFLLFRNPTPTQKYSKAEIELAEKQFRKSLAIVGEAFDKAEKDFSNEIINKQVNKNLNKGYSLVNNILTGG